VVPKARRVGILFSPDEPYAVGMKDKMTEAGRRANMEVVAVPVSSVSEGGSATTTLIGRKVDAIEIFGNSAHASFASIIQVARQNKVPVFSSSPFEMVRGATAAVYPDFQEGGVMAGRMIGRVLKGESPGGIPFYRVVTTKTSTADSARRP
jgi:putative ABC transport system substrate-binding protein